jgi:hypothetical protein
VGCRARARVAVLSTMIVGALAILAPRAVGQASSRPCPPSGERVRWIGTCQTAVDSLGALPQEPMFWHLDTYPTLAAATNDKALRSTVVESLGQIWLFTIAEPRWRSHAGTRVATIGPLPLIPASEYTAVYMQSIFEPGTTTLVHAHSGPEAFFTLSGGTCLETPGEVARDSGAKQILIVREGPPMQLTSFGAELRRGIVLILHDASRPATTFDTTWKPTGRCAR